jgi:hypothetical protein
MRLMSPFSAVSLLCIPMFSGEVATRDPGCSLDWQRFQVPEYGYVEYPAAVFAPVGEAEKGVEREDGRAVLSIYARENEDDDTPASYLTTTHA